MSEQAYPKAFPKDEPGIDLLDYMAGQALVGVLAGYDGVKPDSWLPKPDVIAEYTYKIAKAMIEERQRLG